MKSETREGGLTGPREVSNTQATTIFESGREIKAVQSEGKEEKRWLISSNFINISSTTPRCLLWLL